MKMRSLMVAAVVTSGFGGTVTAAEWDGGYVGVQGGPVIGSSELTYTNGTDTATADGVSTDGIVGGLFAGYGGTFDSDFYLGIQADIMFSNADSTATVNNASASLDVENIWSLSGRAGILLSPEALVYLKAGGGQLNWDASSSAGLSESGSQNAFSFGLGFEHLMGENLSIRGEFLYSLYENETINAGAETVTIDPSSLSATVGVSYRF